MNNEVEIKGIVDELFNKINTYLPYLDINTFSVEIKKAQSEYDNLQKQFKHSKRKMSRDVFLRLEKEQKLIYGCLQILGLLGNVQKVVSRHWIDLYPIMLTGLNNVEIFVENCEVQPAIVNLIEPFLFHISAMVGYYRAIINKEMKRSKK